MPKVSSLGVQYTLKAEFVTGSYTNITDDLLRFNCTRQMGRLGEGISVGEASVTLSNHNKLYSPANSASAYATGMVPGTNIVMQAVNSGTTYNIYTGKISNININPLIGSQVANIDCVDIAEKINRTELKLPIAIGTMPSSLFSQVFSQCGVSSYQIHHALTQIIPYVGWSGINGGTAVNRLIDFGAYYVNVDGGGIVNVRKNYIKTDGTAVSSHDEFFGLTYDTNGKQIINRASVKSKPKKLDTVVSTIGYLLAPQLVKRTDNVSFFVDYVNPYAVFERTPANSASLPDANFKVTTNSDGSGQDITVQCSKYIGFLGSTAVCSIYNGSGLDAYVSTLNIIGYSIYDSPGITQVTNNNSSQNRYGKFEAEIRTDLIDSLVYAKDYASFLVADYAEPLASVSISLNNVYPHVVSLDLGALIHVSENNTAISDRFKILSVDHDIDSLNGVRHVATYRLEKYFDRSLLILGGSPSTGKLDERYLSF